MSFLCLTYIDYHITAVLKPYINSEVERLTNNVVNRAIRKKIYDGNYSFASSNQLLDSLNRFSYDTTMLTKMKDDIAEYVQDILIQMEDGELDDYFVPKRLRFGRFKKIKHGIICDITLGSVRGSTLFANVGPAIPIKLSFLGQIQSDIDVDIKEYGINNVLVKIYLILDIKEQVSMPFSSNRVDIVIKEPIVIDLLQGKTPDYYNAFSK